MDKIVSLSKQSKKNRREYYKKQRGSWCGVCPVTRSVPSGKAYDRKRLKRGDREEQRAEL